ncbi:hypothetical protein TELCIR_20527 [Teladorsagia circumcincta]|uniref:CUB domain-containing protein n=1 Tax=Teladorsagia circumcincta TaxID=45464 RepID=A0A2G9TJA1_TELCI|nr:hypothetical protein TELCIR_20527 [Teladorsagia circumcincta]
MVRIVAQLSGWYSARCEGIPNECNDGFPHPRNCSRCICPSGYGGQFCNERPPGCGQELEATRDWSFVRSDPHNMTAGQQNGYKSCVYWIKAPNNTKIEVEIENFPDGVAVDGCIYAGVEIKTKQDQRLTGYRFCSRDDIGIVLTSDVHTVPVLTYMRRRRNITDIVLGYRYVPLDGAKVEN